MRMGMYATLRIALNETMHKVASAASCVLDGRGASGLRRSMPPCLTTAPVASEGDTDETTAPPAARAPAGGPAVARSGVGGVPRGQPVGSRGGAVRV